MDLGWRNIFPFSLSKGQTACHFLLKEFKPPLFSAGLVFQGGGRQSHESPSLSSSGLWRTVERDEQPDLPAGRSSSSYWLVAGAKSPRITETPPRLQKGYKHNHPAVCGRAQDRWTDAYEGTSHVLIRLQKRSRLWVHETAALPTREAGWNQGLYVRRRNEKQDSKRGTADGHSLSPKGRMGRTTAQRRSHARGGLLPARPRAEAWGGAIQWGQRFPSGLTHWADTEECWQAQEQSKFHPCFLSARSPKPLDAYEPLFSNLIQGRNSVCFRASVRQDVSRHPLRSLKQTGVLFACISAARILCSHGMSSKVTLSLGLYLKPGLLAPRMQGLCLSHFAGHVTGWANVCWLPTESTPLLLSPHQLLKILFQLPSLSFPSPDHYWQWLSNDNSVSETQISSHKGSVDSLSPFTQVLVASWFLQVPERKKKFFPHRSALLPRKGAENRPNSVIT